MNGYQKPSHRITIDTDSVSVIEERPDGGSDNTIAGVEAERRFDELWEREYREWLVTRSLEMMQSDFEPTTWRACWETTVKGRPVEEVARTLGITANAVYLARSRVLRRLRFELSELLEE